MLIKSSFKSIRFYVNVSSYFESIEQEGKICSSGGRLCRKCPKWRLKIWMGLSAVASWVFCHPSQSPFTETCRGEELPPSHFCKCKKKSPFSSVIPGRGQSSNLVGTFPLSALPHVAFHSARKLWGDEMCTDTVGKINEEHL